MGIRARTNLATCASLLAGMAWSTASPAITVEELARKFEEYKEEQDQKFEELKEENRRLREKNVELKSAIDETRDQVEATTAAVESSSEAYAMASPMGNFINRSSIGGYGELHYNNFNKEPGSSDGTPFREIDLHRFVLFFAHEFTDSIRLWSEFEVEHAVSGEGQNGEVEIEQAYLEFDLIQNPWGPLDSANLRAGVYLIPVGILNETHEPDTFYGVERNSVENIIIPTTWWEAGAMTTANFSHGFSLNFGLHSGMEMPTSGSSAYRIRSGRNKVSNAKADDLAGTARLKYTGVPGLELAATVQYQSDITQEQDDGADGAWLFESHLIYNKKLAFGELGLKALYAKWEIDGDAIENAHVTRDGVTSTDGGDDQRGWFIEPSYRFPTAMGDIGLYARYTDVDGFRVQDEFDEWQFGANYWPHQNVVIKADYRTADNDNNSIYDYHGFDLGIGYQFF